ncbi:MAG TPA: DsrE family protein [Desulfomonilaceae bacterium]|nr:DsrE family protein [Desulfomonilaceae bacterium]
MTKSNLAVILVLAATFAISPLVAMADIGSEYSPKGSGNVVVLIQNGDPEMIYFGLLYASRAIKNKWMDNVKVVIWGPAEKTLSGLPTDSEQVKLLKEIQALGGKDGRVWACKACSERYGITKKMEELGCEVFHTGEATSYLLKLGYRLWPW